MLFGLVDDEEVFLTRAADFYCQFRKIPVDDDAVAVDRTGVCGFTSGLFLSLTLVAENCKEPITAAAVMTRVVVYTVFDAEDGTNAADS